MTSGVSVTLGVAEQAVCCRTLHVGQKPAGLCAGYSAQSYKAEVSFVIMASRGRGLRLEEAVRLQPDIHFKILAVRVGKQPSLKPSHRPMSVQRPSFELVTRCEVRMQRTTDFLPRRVPVFAPLCAAVSRLRVSVLNEEFVPCR